MPFGIPGPTGPPSLRKAGAKIRTHAERANKTRDFFRRKSGKTGKHAVTQDNTRGKSSGEKEEGKETDTSIILYIRTEDEGNGSGRERIQARKDGIRDERDGKRTEQARNNKAIGSYLRYANDT